METTIWHLMIPFCELGTVHTKIAKGILQLALLLQLAEEIFLWHNKFFHWFVIVWIKVQHKVKAYSSFNFFLT